MFFLILFDRLIFPESTINIDDTHPMCFKPKEVQIGLKARKELSFGNLPPLKVSRKHLTESQPETANTN